MGRSVNRATLIGNVGKDPDIRTANGRKYANFSVATEEGYKDKTTDEWKNITTWHRISVANDRLVDVVENYVRKGSKVYIEGKIDHRTYMKDGVETTVVEIKLGPYGGELVLINSTDEGGERTSNKPSARSAAKPAARRQEDDPYAGHPDMDDEIPF